MIALQQIWLEGSNAGLAMDSMDGLASQGGALTSPRTTWVVTFLLMEVPFWEPPEGRRHMDDGQSWLILFLRHGFYLAFCIASLHSLCYFLGILCILSSRSTRANFEISTSCAC